MMRTVCLYINSWYIHVNKTCGTVTVKSLCEQRGNEVNSDFWKDMLAAIDHNYNTSAFKGKPLLISYVFLWRTPYCKEEQCTEIIFQTRTFILCFGQQVVHNLTHPMGHSLEKKNAVCISRSVFCFLLVTVLVRMCWSSLTYSTKVLCVFCMYITGKKILNNRHQ